MRLSVGIVAAVVVMGLSMSACKSTHQEGVTSNYMTQWTTVAASTEKTTDAAKAVLEEQGLKEVKASSTNVDGKATGKEADGTVVTVKVKKKTDTSSEASCTVGKMGDPALGAEMVKKIKAKAEGM